MIQVPPALNVVRHMVRDAVCRRCIARPTGSESLAPDVPRSCEATCPVFARLPRLQRLAEQVDPMLRSRARVLEKDILWDCGGPEVAKTNRSTALDADQRCLLSRNARAVAAAVASLYGQ